MADGIIESENGYDLLLTVGVDLNDEDILEALRNIEKDTQKQLDADNSRLNIKINLADGDLKEQVQRQLSEVQQYIGKQKLTVDILGADNNKVKYYTDIAQKQLGTIRNNIVKNYGDAMGITAEQALRDLSKTFNNGKILNLDELGTKAAEGFWTNLQKSFTNENGKAIQVPININAADLDNQVKILSEIQVLYKNVGEAVQKSFGSLAPSNKVFKEISQQLGTIFGSNSSKLINQFENLNTKGIRETIELIQNLDLANLSGQSANLAKIYQTVDKNVSDALAKLVEYDNLLARIGDKDEINKNLERSKLLVEQIDEYQSTGDTKTDKDNLKAMANEWLGYVREYKQLGGEITNDIYQSFFKIQELLGSKFQRVSLDDILGSVPTKEVIESKRERELKQLLVDLNRSNSELANNDAVMRQANQVNQYSDQILAAQSHIDELRSSLEKIDNQEYLTGIKKELAEMTEQVISITGKGTEGISTGEAEVLSAFANKVNDYIRYGGVFGKNNRTDQSITTAYNDILSNSSFQDMYGSLDNVSKVSTEQINSEIGKTSNVINSLIIDINSLVQSLSTASEKAEQFSGDTSLKNKVEELNSVISKLSDVVSGYAKELQTSTDAESKAAEKQQELTNRIANVRKNKGKIPTQSTESTDSTTESKGTDNGGLDSTIQKASEAIEEVKELTNALVEKNKVESESQVNQNDRQNEIVEQETKAVEELAQAKKKETEAEEQNTKAKQENEQVAKQQAEQSTKSGQTIVQNNGDVQTGVTTVESGNVEALAKAVNEVTDAVKQKTAAFEEEDTAVKTVVNNEIGYLDNLGSKVSEVRQKVNTIDDDLLTNGDSTEEFNQFGFLVDNVKEDLQLIDSVITQVNGEIKTLDLSGIIKGEVPTEQLANLKKVIPLLESLSKNIKDGFTVDSLNILAEGLLKLKQVGEVKANISVKGLSTIVKYADNADDMMNLANALTNFAVAVESLVGVLPTDKSSFLSGLKISEGNVKNMTALADALGTVREQMDKFSDSSKNILASLSELSSQVAGLKNISKYMNELAKSEEKAKDKVNQNNNLENESNSSNKNSDKALKLQEKYEASIIRLKEIRENSDNQTIVAIGNQNGALKEQIKAKNNIVQQEQKEYETAKKILQTYWDLNNAVEGMPLKNNLPEELTELTFTDSFKSSNATTLSTNGNFLANISGSVDIDSASNKIQEFLNKFAKINKELTVVSNNKGLITLKAQATDLTNETYDLAFAVDKVNGNINYTSTSVSKTLSGIPKAIEAVKSKVKELAVYWTAMYLNPFDIINGLKQLVSVIQEYDDALTEMKKVSDESTASLKLFQKQSFELADKVGTSAEQLQSSTADFLRIGESLSEASESAQVANKLLNVSEFESIDDATESLVAMSQAYKDLSKEEIVDKVNWVGKITLPKRIVICG